MDLKNKEISELLNKEWLETNGIGGYASSSITGANTRKYHGLLVAAFNPPTTRQVLVAKVEERIITGDSICDISVNKFNPEEIYPKGHKYLTSFERRPIATWIYESKDWKLQKKLFMVPDSNTTIIVYENLGAKSMEIETHPLFEQKGYHSISKENHFDFYYENDKSSIKVHAYPDSPAVYMSWSKGDFEENRAWYRNFKLEKEQYRGQECIEDYYRIGFLKTKLGSGQKVSLVFTTDSTMIQKRVSILEKKVISHINAIKSPEVKDSFYNDLLVSGNQFLVNRASTESKTVLAGYHWFTDWGRDTMIAMRGLTIATGNQKASKSILSTFFKYLDQGMLPNRFPDHEDQEIEYNTIDATLWLFIALYEYHEKFDDLDFMKEHMKDLESILHNHIKGTRYNIHVTEEGFISGGQEGWQLTWMDARIGDHVVTARKGCPVEINALWYNAISVYEVFCETCETKPLKEVKEVKNNFEKNFKKRFLSKKGYLFDFLDSDGEPNTNFRPNQIHVVSLPFSILNEKEEKKIVKIVGNKLLTDYGLRTLDTDNPHYIGHYRGNEWDRDTAYHQGTVWPFILMEYWEAYLKVNRYSEKSKSEVINALKPLKKHFYEDNCVHGISEIFDGEEPKDGRGCIQQAWSVAALIKLYTDHQLYR